MRLSIAQRWESAFRASCVLFHRFLAGHKDSGVVALSNWPLETLSVVDAIECMVMVLADRGPEILLMSTVDEADFIGPSECFMLSAEKLPRVSAEVMFERPTRLGAARVLFGTRSSGPIATVQPEDRKLAEWLIDQATARGFGVAEVVLTYGNTFRLMIETLREEGLAGASE